MSFAHDLRFDPVEQGQNHNTHQNQTKNPARGGVFCLVAGVGFEPTTFRL